MVLELGWSFACLSWFQFLFSLDVGEDEGVKESNIDWVSAWVMA